MVHTQWGSAVRLIENAVFLYW